METRPKRDDSVHVRLPSALKKRLLEKASREDRSVAYVILKILEDWSIGPANEQHSPRSRR